MAFKIVASLMFSFMSGILIQSLVRQRARASIVSYYYRYESPYAYWFTVFGHAFGAFLGLIMVVWAFLI